MSANLTAPGRRGAGRLLNAAIAFAALVVAGLLVKNSLSAPPEPPALAPSARIFVEGVDWAKAEQTLLVAVRSDCAYCTNSARFYRRLLEGLSGRKDARAVFIYPDEAPRGEAYLRELGLAPAQSSRQRLAPLGIRNVPTLALVGRDGTVGRVWVGELSPKKETEVLAALRFEDTRAVADWTIDEAGLRRRLAGGEPLLVVDLRQRGAYMSGHPAGAKNIPWDEIYARALNELPRDRTVVLYGDDQIQADVAYSQLFRLGYRNVLVYAGGPLAAGPAG